MLIVHHQSVWHDIVVHKGLAQKFYTLWLYIGYLYFFFNFCLCDRDKQEWMVTPELVDPVEIEDPLDKLEPWELLAKL